MPVPNRAHVRYVDRFDEHGLRDHYPELKDLPLVRVDVIDDGERLASFRANSLDFIIANHFIEHTEDPIGTIRRHIEVLRRGGVLYMAVPDKRFTFDQPRALTTVDHLVRDHRDGPHVSRDSHYLEVASLSESSESIQSVADTLKAKNYSIHFHVWTKDTFRDFITYALEQSLIAAKLEYIESNPQLTDEFIVVLRKT